MYDMCCCCCCCCDEGAGIPPEPDIGAELVGNGGNPPSSYCGGGGGNPSDAVGELLLLRTKEFNDGENNPLGGKSGLLNELCGHGCGVFPAGKAYGVRPLPGTVQ